MSGRRALDPVRLRLGFPGDPRSRSLGLSGWASAAALREEGRLARPPLWLPQPESPPRPVEGNGGRDPETHGETDSGQPTSKPRARGRRCWALPPPPAPTVGGGPGPKPTSEQRGPRREPGGSPRSREGPRPQGPPRPHPRASGLSACSADACLRTPTCPDPAQARGSRSAGQGGQLGSGGRPGSPPPIPTAASLGGQVPPAPTCPRGICPPLVLARLSAWVDTSQASRGAVMGLMATSAAPGDLEPQGRAPVPPGAASIGVIPL